MKNSILHVLCFTLFSASFSFGQYDEVSHGAGYAKHTFYDITSGSVKENNLTDWDIAFSFNTFGLGILINEGVASGAGATGVELYNPDGSTYQDMDTIGMFRLFNSEDNWDNGAFNSPKDTSSQIDFGWGIYDFTTHIVNGSRPYVIKLRDGSFKKIFIEKYASGVYTFKYADLDGANEIVKEIAKSEFLNKTLAYFSFTTGESVDLEPESWDLLFTRYIVPLDDGTGNILDYGVTGTLSNSTVEIAKVAGVDPSGLDFRDYVDDLVSNIGIIGYDWKTFDLSSFMWIIPDDLSYFVKTKDNNIWQLQFIDFAGSSSGTVTIFKELAGALKSVEKPEAIESYSVFPTINSGSFNVAFESTEFIKNLEINIISLSGQTVLSEKHTVQPGFNLIQLNKIGLASGTYIVTLRDGQSLISEKIVIQ